MSSSCKPSIHSLTLTLCVAVTSFALSACGGGGGGNEPPSPTPEAFINSSNYEATAGIAAAGTQHSAEMLLAGVLPINAIAADAPAGNYPCIAGGSMTLSVVDKVRNYSAQSCQTGEAFLASGSISDTVGQGNGGHSLLIKDLVFRVGDSAAPLQTLNGSVAASLNAQGLPSAVIADLSLSQGTRTQTYALTMDASGKLLIVLQTPSLAQKLVYTIDPQSSSVKVSSRGDGSSVTIVESADGKSYTLELRPDSSASSPTASKTLSAAEFEALLKKSL
nr:hypothetical protein [uncultured Roseateles sp.]